MSIEEHQPYFNSSNKEIPSVTTVLKILNKPELVDWANWMGKIGKDSKEFTQQSAQVGTYTHYIIERICKKKIIRLDDMYDTLSKGQIKKVEKAVGSFKKWKKETKPKFKHNELKVQDERLGGTIDCICKIDGLTYMVDFKTSKQVYPSYFLQLAGYNYLYKRVYNKSIDKAGILVLDKYKYRYEFVYTDIEIIEKYYEPVFLKLLDVYYEWRDILYYDWNKEL